jgi:AcrR family transcriptional regulator
MKEARETPSASTRAAIVAEADRLIYERGFAATSITHIAEAVGIARGNLTYHFKSKDAVLEAVILARLGATSQMLEAWEAEARTPAGRIRRYMHILIANRRKILPHGCPVGTLSTELAKLDHPALSHAAEVFSLFRDWLRLLFGQMGYGAAEADALAMHVLVLSQGVATLANAFQDEAFLRREVARMDDWLDGVVKAAPHHRETGE